MQQDQQKVTVEGDLWFSKDSDRFLGGDRIALLDKIDELGSITQAAKAVGISYKTAWEMVNQINNLAEAKLSTRNQLTGSITKLIKGPVSCEVDLELPGGTTISAVITDGSAKRLGLKVGSSATALFKASSVIIGVS